MRRMIVAVAALAAFTGSAAAQGAVEVEAEVVRVIDGDTVMVVARPWPDLAITTRVRLLGIDTPERGGRARCPAEAALAMRAADATRDLLAAGAHVRLSGVTSDKYGSRVVAAIAAPDGRDVGTMLLAAGLARAYDGGRKPSWCP